MALRAPAAEPALVGAAHDGRRVAALWADGRRSELHALWLRDNCQCPACHDEASGQRILDPAELRPDLGIQAAEVEVGGELDIAWTDGHRGRFPTDWLRAHASPAVQPGQARQWEAGTPGVPFAAEHRSVARGGRALRAWLAAASEDGVALLRGVPSRDGEVARVAELFGHVRETNYGRVFDVRVVPGAAHLADSARALAPHTDNPYRDPVPSLQLLHCLVADPGGGGDTVLVDGLRVAHALREVDADAFSLLSRVPVRFAYRARDVDLEAETTVIGRDGAGQVVAIAFNGRSMAPLDLPAHLVGPYYAAYLRFARLLGDRRFAVRLALRPGELVLLDNRRVLHGRTALTGGQRHLQGCYADRDGLRSRLAVLLRDEADGRP